DQKPHIYRTHDGGASWKEIVQGLPDGPVNTVREDPLKRGLLYAGTERAVYVSFDGGEHWHSLRFNMPATSIRDLVIHDDDVVVGTHGRSFWILDDITPLRQITGGVLNTPVHLFAPRIAHRVKRNVNTDTPLPPEEPAGMNPPDGAIIYYYLRTPRPVTLEILDSKGQLVRRYSSEDDLTEIDEKDYAVPSYWYRLPQELLTDPGVQRYVWDLKYAPPLAFSHGFPISAIYRDTPLSPLGPAVLPGTYTVKLTVDGKSFTHPLVVKMDPRVKTGLPGLSQQFTLSLEAYRGMEDTYALAMEAKKLRSQIAERINRVGRGPLAESLAKLDKAILAIAGEARGDAGGGGLDVRETNFTRLNGGLASLMEMLQGADLPPTMPMVNGAVETQKALARLKANWSQLKAKDLTSINANLRLANQPELVP
ncbi:MAG TPA: hypothetical protein VL866_16825, partial [Pyrinomonadaceae bacterium]|nr:hypothetical protein [Pyrinomonadaceae bacterium]